MSLMKGRDVQVKLWGKRRVLAEQIYLMQIANFAQGCLSWVASQYKVQEPRTGTSLLEEHAFVNQAGCVSGG